MINTIHPGEFLNEILDDADITPYRIAKDIHVPPTHISEIMKGNRSITIDTAMRLSAYLGTNPSTGSTYKIVMIYHNTR